MAVVILRYVYFGTSFLPFNYPVRKAKIEAMEKEHEKLSAELEKARKIVGNLARLEAEYERCTTSGSPPRNSFPRTRKCPTCCAR